MTRRSSSSPRLARQAAELAFAVPQVMAHRLTRMALAGAQPNARDRREFDGMKQEKVVAMWQSWFAMGAAMVQAQQKVGLALMQGKAPPLVDAQRILSQGLAPVHRKATANAKRLARTRLR